MKIYNPFTVAEDATSPLLMLCIIILVVCSLFTSVFLFGPLTFLIIPIGAFLRILYAVFAGK